MQIVRRYKATAGAQFPRKKAQKYGECLDKIAKKNNGELRPIDAVDEARSKTNPLHDVFEWDNSKAAESYRLVQARALINHFIVEIRYDHRVKEHKAWFNLDTSEDENKINKVYVSVEDVMSKKSLREQILLNAIQELEYWQSKYEEYRELNRVFSAIRLVKKKLKSKIKRIRGKKKR